MDVTPVVTCLLRDRGRLLLARRSDAVGSYRGQWAGVSGHLAPERGAPPDDPETAARREIPEETGLADAVTLVRRGDPLDVRDDDYGTVWRVHPLLFDCDSPAVDPNEEITAVEWVHAPEIRRRETVPRLWDAYDRVRPTVQTIRDDRDHGAAWLSVRALEALRDEAALAGDTDSLRTLARDVAAARPSMTPLRTRLARAVGAAESADDAPTPQSFERAAREAIDAAVVADEQAAATAATLDASRVVTLSRSSTVRAALDRLDPEAVLIAVSDPGGEGVDVAVETADATAVTLTSDAGLAAAVAEFDPDAALVGADTVFSDGRLLNKVGTRGLALACAHEGVPLYAVTATAKITDRTRPVVESAGPIDRAPAAVETANPLFDVTPPSLIAGYCTEDGLLDTEDVTTLAGEVPDL